MLLGSRMSATGAMMPTMAMSRPRWRRTRFRRRALPAVLQVVREATGLCQAAPEPWHTHEAEAARNEQGSPTMGQPVDEGEDGDRQGPAHPAHRREQPDPPAALVGGELLAHDDA